MIFKHTNQYFRSSCFIVGLAFLTLLNLATPAQCEPAPTTYNTPWLVVMQTAHNSKTSKPGEHFSSVLTQSYCVQSSCIPENTILQGQVVRVRPSHRLHRPGYLAFQINEVNFPDGSNVLLPIHQKGHDDEILYNKKSKRLHQFILDQVPEAATGYGATRLLNEYNEVWHLSTGVLNITTFGIGAAVSVAIELVHPEEAHRSIPARIGWGLINSTGIPDLVRLAVKEPEATIHEGEQLKIKLSTDNAKLVYAQASLIGPEPPLPALPTITDPEEETEPNVTAPEHNDFEAIMSLEQAKATAFDPAQS